MAAPQVSFEGRPSVLVDVKERSPRWLKDAANAATRRYALATAGWRETPDFLVIGTKRGGTTSLFNYLLMHAGVLGLFPQPRGRKSSDYFFMDLNRGEPWYRSHFHTTAFKEHKRRQLGYRPVTGEASPYYLWDPRIAGAVHDVAPAIKSIVLLRDPVKRAWSHYLERRANGVEPLTFADALAVEDSRMAGELERMAEDPTYYSRAHDWYSYRSRGIYLPQLLNWERHFPEGQTLVLRSEDMYEDVQGVFDTVCTFLGIPAATLPTTKAFGARNSSEQMPEDVRADLAAFYAPHNRMLEQSLGRQLGWSTPVRS